MSEDAIRRMEYDRLEPSVYDYVERCARIRPPLQPLIYCPTCAPLTQPGPYERLERVWCRYHILEGAVHMGWATWSERLEYWARRLAWPFYEVATLGLMAVSFTYLALHIYWWHAVGFRVVGQ